MIELFILFYGSLLIDFLFFWKKKKKRTSVIGFLNVEWSNLSNVRVKPVNESTNGISNFMCKSSPSLVNWGCGSCLTINTRSPDIGWSFIEPPEIWFPWPSKT